MKKIAALAIIVVILLSALAGYALFTPAGAGYLLRVAVAFSGNAESCRWQAIDGSLAGKFEIRKIEIERFERGGIVAGFRAERVVVDRVLSRFRKLDVFGARLAFPGIGTIEFDARVSGESLFVEAKSGRLDAGGFSDFAPALAKHAFRGGLTDLRCRIDGTPAAFAFDVSGKVDSVEIDAWRIDRGVFSLKGEMETEKGLEGITGRSVGKNIAGVWKPMPGIPCRIDLITVSKRGGGLEDCFGELTNLTLSPPGSEPILIQGSVNAGELDLNVYCGALDIAPFLERFASPGPFSGAKGALAGVDLDVTGLILKPVVIGELTMERFSLKDFSLANIHAGLDLKVLETAGDIRLGGKVICEGGTLSGNNTALIRLEKATFMFHGPAGNPSLDIAAAADVRGTEIRLVVKGTPEQPELRLSSKPAKSRETLLLMLATDREWKGVEKTLEGEGVPAEVANDLLGYLVWGRVEETLARTLKLDRVALEMQEEKKGVSISKRVNESTRVDVNAAREGETVKSKAGVTVKLTPDFAVEAEKNLRQEDGAGGEPEGDKVMLKFKKDF